MYVVHRMDVKLGVLSVGIKWVNVEDLVVSFVKRWQAFASSANSSSNRHGGIALAAQQCPNKMMLHVAMCCIRKKAVLKSVTLHASYLARFPVFAYLCHECFFRTHVLMLSGVVAEFEFRGRLAEPSILIL